MGDFPSRRLLPFVLAAALFVCVAHNAAAFSEQDILSPVAGTWNNIQPLVLNVSDGSEVFYSLSGADPLYSGFAYDGPVVIDQEGEVHVRITALSLDGERSDYSVAYTVPQDSPNETADAFVRAISDNPIRIYRSGTELSLPETCRYCIGRMEGRYLEGRTVALSEKNMLERYVPFFMTDGTYRYHFVIHVVADRKNMPAPRSLPFIISNWHTVIFTDARFVYRLDGGAWTRADDSMTVDRLSTHTLWWKLPDSDEVATCTLPPMPRLVTTQREDGSVGISVTSLSLGRGNGTAFLLGAPPHTLATEAIAPGAFADIAVDAFYGEQLEGQLAVGVYYDGVYQGSLPCSYAIDRLPPEAPRIRSSAARLFAQNKVSVHVEAEPNAAVYVAVSEPLAFDVEGSHKDSADFDAVPAGSYSLYFGTGLTLSSLAEQATFYKVTAYAVDGAGNRSGITEYRVVVDEYNYYLAAGTDDAARDADGSYNNPFTNFEQAVAAINRSDNMRLHVSGTVHIRSPQEISSHCRLMGNDCRLVFEDGADLRVTGASVHIQNCRIEATARAADASRLLRLRDSSLTVSDCELVGQFQRQAVLMDARNATLSLLRSGCTVQAASYATVIKAEDSTIFLESCRFVSMARTSVSVSVSGGRCILQNSLYSIAGQSGMNLELLHTRASLQGNSFVAHFESTAPSSLRAVWQDVDTVIDIYEDNLVRGY